MQRLFSRVVVFAAPRSLLPILILIHFLLLVILRQPAEHLSDAPVPFYPLHEDDARAHIDAFDARHVDARSQTPGEAFGLLGYALLCQCPVERGVPVRFREAVLEEQRGCRGGRGLVERGDLVCFL